MSYEPDADVNTSIFASMSGKKLVFLTVIIIVGGFFGIQAMFGFPIKDLIRSDVTEQSKIIIKSAGTCVVGGLISILGVFLIVRITLGIPCLLLTNKEQPQSKSID